MNSCSMVGGACLSLQPKGAIANLHPQSIEESYQQQGASFLNVEAICKAKIDNFSFRNKSTAVSLIVH